MALFTKLFGSVRTKMPTVKEDQAAYASGGQKTYNADYNEYVESVESLDRAIRVLSNVASMAKFKISREVNNELKPFKVKNIDLAYNINDRDSQGDFIGLIFGSIFTQGASIIIAEENKKTKFINFFCYDASRFEVVPTENNLVSAFKYTSQSGTEMTFKPEAVIYTSPRYNPANLVYATSRLKSMNDLFIMQANIMKQQSDYYAAGGKDSAIISPKEPMSQEKANQLKTAFDTFLGTTATKTLFLNTEVDVASISNAQSPSQIMEALTKINNQIIRQFGIPDYLFGDYQGYINDAAIVTASRIFFQVHMKPVFNSIAHQFTQYFRNTLALKNVVVTFDYSDVEILEDNLSAKIENASKMYKLGLLSLNEARIECEKEPLPDEAADRHFVPSYLTGQYPVSIEEFDTTLEKLFASQGVMPNTATGSSGGEDNMNQVTDSQGGAGNVGE